MHFYIAKRWCGCIIGGHTDHKQTDRKVLAKWIKDWIKRGYTVERIEAESVAIPLRKCGHRRSQRQLDLMGM